MNNKLLLTLISTLLMTSLSALANNQYSTRSHSPLSCESPQKEVEDFLSQHEVDEITNYCQIGKLNCRSLVFYKNSTSGERVGTFEDRFISSEKNSNMTASSRSVASRAFFMEQANGRHNLYLQESFKNEVEITQVIPQNQNIRVKLDSDGYPSFAIHFLVLGTTDTIKAHANFSSHWASISNMKYESDPSKTFTLKFIQKP